VRAIGVTAVLLVAIQWAGADVAATEAAVAEERGRVPCADAVLPVDCDWLVVPVDYADPTSPTVSLSMRRLSATDEKKRLGVLVTIAGGPGQRGTDLVRPGTHMPAIEEHFDIVSWDPRGTSHETHIDCMPEWDPFEGFDRTPDTTAERRLLDKRTRQLAQRCRNAHAELLPFLGTLQSVLDLEQLRRMVGVERISIMASSYGTQVAVMYATMFPDRVRAVVLDGFSDPNLQPDEREVVQAAAFERELDRLLAECATDRQCPFHSGGRPHDALDRLLERLDAEPGLVSGSTERAASQSDAYEAILGSLVAGPDVRARLLSALAGAASGDSTPLRAIAEGIRSSYESTGLDQGTFMATYCADSATFWRGMSKEDVTRLTRRIHDIAPRLGPWLWSPPASLSLPPVGLCEMQPEVPRRTAEHFDAAGAGPILVLGTTGDPTTPVEAAQAATDELALATLLTLEADHHLAHLVAVNDPHQPAHGCVLDAVESYLIDLEMPVAGTVCR